MLILHFLCRRGVFLHVRMFQHTVFEKIHAETFVQLWNDILVLSKYLVGRKDLNSDNPYRFIWYKILELNKKPLQMFLLHVFWKRKYQVNNLVVTIRTVHLTVCARQCSCLCWRPCDLKISFSHWNMPWNTWNRQWGSSNLIKSGLRYPTYKWAIFMPGKVLNIIYFLKGNNANNSNLILLGLEKQRVITLEA